MSFSGSTLTVTAASSGSNDTVNVNVNGTDVQVTLTAGNTVAQHATAIKTAIEAHSDYASMGVSVTDNSDGTLSFAPTTTYTYSTDGGSTYGSSATYAANGVEGVANAIAAAINARTSSDFAGLTATAASDGSVTLVQDIVWSAASHSDEEAAASVNTAGNQLTIDTGTTSGSTLTFDINGTTVAITTATDQYTDDINGFKAHLEAAIAANAALGGLDLTVAIANTDNLVITAAAKTTSLITDVSTAAASASSATSALSVSTAAGSQAAINSIDTAITTVNSQRATLGAVSNRLDSTVNNLTNISSNLQAGRGRIEDADFAAETTALAKAQILQQASTAMLAQANAAKQNVLSLLQG
jgi:flagellin